MLLCVKEWRKVWPHYLHLHPCSKRACLSILVVWIVSCYLVWCWLCISFTWQGFGGRERGDLVAGLASVSRTQQLSYFRSETTPAGSERDPLLARAATPDPGRALFMKKKKKKKPTAQRQLREMCKKMWEKELSSLQGQCRRMARGAGAQVPMWPVERSLVEQAVPSPPQHDQHRHGFGKQQQAVQFCIR